MVEAQALVIFGEGGQALFYDDKNPEDTREGVKVQALLIAPSEELKVKYKLTDDDLPILTDDGKKAMWVKYPIKQIDWLNRSKTGAVIFIWCAFDSGDTPIMRKMDEMLEWDKQRDKTESRLRAHISSLQRELEDVTSNQVELMRKLKEMEEVINKREDESDEDEG